MLVGSQGVCLYFEGVPKRVPNSRGVCLGKGPFLTRLCSPQARPLCTVPCWPTTPPFREGTAPRGALHGAPPLPKTDSAVWSCSCRWGQTAAARYRPPKDPPGTPRLSRCPSDPLGLPHRPLCPSKSHPKAPVCWADLSSWPLGYLGRVGEGCETPQHLCAPQKPLCLLSGLDKPVLPGTGISQGPFGEVEEVVGVGTSSEGCHPKVRLLP